MIYGIIIFVVIFLLIALIISKKILSPRLKGRKGEIVVARILGKTISGRQYVINDLLFSDQLGHSCQIDHIYINRYGIWIIETKNYSGQIYGTIDQREWTQVLAYGNTKNHFYNPIKQNTTHIYRLAEYLNEKNIFHNIICFLNQADLTNITIANVFTVNNIKFIKSTQTDINLSVERMESIYTKLLNLKHNNQTGRKQHIKNIHKMQRDVKKGICPRCGSELVVRKGKNGQFYGCSSYPDCKFTKKID